MKRLFSCLLRFAPDDFHQALAQIRPAQHSRAERGYAPVRRAGAGTDAAGLAPTLQTSAGLTPEHSVEKRFANREPALAAVLLPLVMRDELTLLLTQRADNMSTHSGQIALPGGKTDETDHDAVDTALREAHEEIGLAREHVEVLGILPTYVTGTAFIITPVVALVQPGFALQPNPSEVADIFEVPLRYLMDPAHHRRHEFEFDGVLRQWLSMPYTGEDSDDAKERYIWGATAGMLRNLYRFLSA
jgi:8-oxo-dGTP pyrophosphatase MutT (NUDIX family)